MKRFVASQNIKHFNEMLAAETRPAQRALLERMIAEEESKLGLPGPDARKPDADAE